jgi:hypothetical protein
VAKRIHQEFLNGVTIGRKGQPILQLLMGQNRFSLGECRVETPGVTNQTKIFVVYNVIIGKSGTAFDISRMEGEYVIVRSLKTPQGAIETGDNSVFDWIALEPELIE